MAQREKAMEDVPHRFAAVPVVRGKPGAGVALTQCVRGIGGAERIADEVEEDG